MAGRGFGTATELPLREQVAKALVNKGVVLGQFGRSDEAATIFDDVIARFGTATELPLREQVAKALVSKGITLGQLGRGREAVAIYEDVIARFGEAEDPALKTIVERARRLKEMKNQSTKKPGPAAQRAKKSRKR